MSLHAKMTCFPLLEKLEGDELIPSITPVIDAQFFIGKGWDATLRLSRPDISDKHCTIEKIELEKWTVVAHDNGVIEINNLRLQQGLPRILKFGDILRISSSISFQFKCSCMNCDNPPSDNIPVVKRRKLSPVTYTTSESTSQSSFHVPNGENLKSRYEQLLNENVSLSARLKKAEDVAVFWENEKFKTESLYFNVMENYRSIHDKYSQLRRLKEESERNQNSDMKSLRDTVSNQASVIERLQLQLNQFQQEICNLERFKHNLEGQNKQLITDNAVLHLRVEKFLEYAKTLHCKNVDLQTEVNDLKKKKDDLQKELDCKTDNSVHFPVAIGSSESSEASEQSNSKVQNSLTELLETEFKCSICDEVFIEAVVTNCTHIFCSYCIKSWKSIKPNCPICRTILTREVKVLTIDSFLTSIMSLVTENLRINWLKISEERKALKETAVAKPKEYLGLPFNPPSTSSSSSTSENVGNFHNALMNVYRHLMHYDDVIDLTNDRIYGL